MLSAKALAGRTRVPDDTIDLNIEKYGIGQPVPRMEDPRLLRGDGCYTDDFNLVNQAHGYFLRSPYAHGIISTLDVSAARSAPGVLAVITHDDTSAAGIGTIPNMQPIKNRNGEPMLKPARPVLADGKVRYRGEAVALVVAETREQARDAAELIELEVDELPAVTDAIEGAKDGAPQLHDDVPSNVAIEWEFGDSEAVEKIFNSAHHVTTLQMRNNRLVVAAMEPRAAVTEYDASKGKYIIHVATQGVFGFRNMLARRIMNVETDELQVKTYDVGGSFGMKSGQYQEYAPLLLAAKQLGRPVKWRDDRSDSFLSDQHGRDSHAKMSLALDKDGKILAARGELFANLGAYLTAPGPNMHTGNLVKNFPGVYRLPAFHARTTAVFTNTTPVGAYRGAGRPEGVYYMERLMDEAAREMGMDRVELRRRNFVTADEMPYAAVSNLTYDSGDFPAVLDDALAQADWDGFEERRKASAAAGRLRGLGLACYLEVTGPPATEMGAIRFDDDGTVSITTGSQNYGQGHAATFAQMIVTKLGIPFDKLKIVQGDSDLLIAGSGTGGSRTVITVGHTLMVASDQLIEKGRKLAGHVLETAAADIEFEAGEFRVAGTDRAIGIMELAREVRAMDIGGDLPKSLDVEVAEESPPSAFPNGCHIAEVEIDPDTGAVTLDRYVVVDDFGVMINPMLVEGQVHGGVSQGLGQVLMEDVRYDADGQLVSGSYMDYAMPRASDFPDMQFGSHPVPAASNSLGAKGCGEAGTTGALPSIMNAIVDVLAREANVTHLDMPATAERVWRALNGSH